MSATLMASVVPDSEIQALDLLRASLPKGSELAKALGTMSEGLASGVDVTVARDDDQLTPSRAAAILGISRTHLYKVLDAGVLEFSTVGARDRRIRMSDLRAYWIRTQAFRAADAESIAKRQQLEDDLLNEME